MENPQHSTTSDSSVTANHISVDSNNIHSNHVETPSVGNTSTLSDKSPLNAKGLSFTEKLQLEKQQPRTPSANKSIAHIPSPFTNDDAKIPTEILRINQNRSLPVAQTWPEEDYTSAVKESEKDETKEISRAGGNLPTNEEFQMQLDSIELEGIENKNKEINTTDSYLTIEDELAELNAGEVPRTPPSQYLQDPFATTPTSKPSKRKRNNISMSSPLIPSSSLFHSKEIPQPFTPEPHSTLKKQNDSRLISSNSFRSTNQYVEPIEFKTPTKNRKSHSFSGPSTPTRSSHKKSTSIDSGIRQSPFDSDSDQTPEHTPPRKTMIVSSPSSGKLKKIKLKIKNGIPIDPTGMFGFPEFVYNDSDVDEDYNEGSGARKSAKKPRKKIASDAVPTPPRALSPTPHGKQSDNSSAVLSSEMIPDSEQVVRRKPGRPKKSTDGEPGTIGGEWKRKQVDAYLQLQQERKGRISQNEPKRKEKSKRTIYSSSLEGDDAKSPPAEKKSVSASTSSSVFSFSSDGSESNDENPNNVSGEQKKDIKKRTTKYKKSAQIRLRVLTSSGSSDSDSDSESVKDYPKIDVQEALEFERQRSRPARDSSQSDQQQSKRRRMEKSSSAVMLYVGSKRKTAIPSSKVNTPDKSGRTAIFKYAQSGDIESCKTLISYGADLHHQDYAGWTPLHVACLGGRLEVVRLLLQYGADVNCAGGDLDTPLHDAVSNNHLEVIRELLMHGASIESKNAHSRSPLDIAREQADEMEFEDSTMNDGTTTNSTSRTVNLYELLLKWDEMRVKVCERDAEGLTILHKAAIAGDYNLAEKYLSFGAGVDSVDNFGWRPIHEASAHGHARVVELLLQHGASVNEGPIVEGEMRTPLLDAISGCWCNVVEVLLEYGADVGDKRIWELIENLEKEELEKKERDTPTEKKEVVETTSLIEKMKLLLEEKITQEDNGTRGNKVPLFRPQMINSGLDILSTSNDRDNFDHDDLGDVMMNPSTRNSKSSHTRRMSASGISEGSSSNHKYESNARTVTHNYDAVSSSSSHKLKSGTLSNRKANTIAGDNPAIPSNAAQFGYHLHNLPSYASITSRNEYFAWGGLLPRDGEFESTREERKFKETLKRLQSQPQERRHGRTFSGLDQYDEQPRKEVKHSRSRSEKDVSRVSSGSRRAEREEKEGKGEDMDETVKRKRGRPRKNPLSEENVVDSRDSEPFSPVSPKLKSERSYVAPKSSSKESTSLRKGSSSQTSKRNGTGAEHDLNDAKQRKWTVTKESIEEDDDAVPVKSTEEESQHPIKKRAGRPRKKPDSSLVDEEIPSSRSQDKVKSGFRSGKWGDPENMSSDEDDVMDDAQFQAAIRKFGNGSNRDSVSPPPQKSNRKSNKTSPSTDKKSSSVKPSQTSKIDSGKSKEAPSTPKGTKAVKVVGKKKSGKRLFGMSSGYVALDEDGNPIPDPENPIETSTSFTAAESNYDDAKKEEITESTTADAKMNDDNLDISFSDEPSQIEPASDHVAQEELVNDTKPREKAHPKMRKVRRMFGVSGYETVQQEATLSETEQKPEFTTTPHAAPRSLVEPARRCLPFYAVLLPQSITSNTIISSGSNNSAGIAIAHIPPNTQSNSQSSSISRPRYLVDLQVGLFLGLGSGQALLNRHPHLSRRVASHFEKCQLENSPISELMFECLEYQLDSVKNEIDINQNSITTKSGKKGVQLRNMEVHFIREDEVIAIVLEQSGSEDCSKTELFGVNTIELNLEEFTKMDDVSVKVEMKELETLSVPFKDSPAPVNNVALPTNFGNTSNLNSQNMKRVPLKAKLKMALKNGDINK
ncbi:hypothetical protein HK098_007020 [Nowakowskiella sp. JEL0407]|nr:hypothetical protein HK098_007020 [Nowakowskiella sp. JEL0407]